MKKLTSKRFILTVYITTVLAAMGLISLGKEMQGVATAVIGVLGGVIGWYVKKESDTPSK